MDKGIVNIHGKEYHTVSKRVSQFREAHPKYQIVTELVRADDDMVVMKAFINDEEGKVIATGYAEEVRGSSNINKTSALENCETSAIGRALAFFGLAGTEIASADEVVNAINQQKEKEIYDRFVKFSRAAFDNIETLQCMRQAIIEGNLSAAKEAWMELSEDEMRAIWMAPSKGGYFTTEERAIIKSPEWKEA